MDKSTKVNTKWICEECGREYVELPFPANCACGNWVEDFFREKDRYDAEDDIAGRPLLGIKYDPKVLKEREERLKEGGPVVQTIEAEEETVTFDFDSMSKVQLRRYLQSVGSPAADLQAKQEVLVTACKRWDEADKAW